MKEIDIVDFSKMEHDENEDPIDENGNDIGCLICHTHELAYKKFDGMYEKMKSQRSIRENIYTPICPKCGNLMDISCPYGYDEAVVSEVNYSNPDGEIGLYPVFECSTCDQTYALMPVPISYNGNHDIFYTGGKDYLMDKDQEELRDLIFEKIKHSIEQYVRMVVDEKDKTLSLWNIKLWCERDVEHAIAEWLYKHGLKK